MSINDGRNNLAALFNDNILSVPTFQRAYAWESAHLHSFVEDIRNHPTKNNKGYFFGTILLTFGKSQPSQQNSSYDVVDGQQRLTTVCIFFAVAIAKLRLDTAFKQTAEKYFGRMLKEGSTRKFHTISDDEAFFEQLLCTESSDSNVSLSSCITPSQKRLFNAKVFFENIISKMNVAQVDSMLLTLWTAQILVYAVSTNIEATQIFELQNDRGKRLTNLEALKSFLMHGLFVNAGDNTESDLHIVQSNFAHIYRNVEKMENIFDAPDEDQLLSYHCIAFEPWVTLEGDTDGWRKPKDLIRNVLTGVPINGRADWIKSCSNRLKDSYEIALQALQARDNYSCIPMGDLAALGRVAPFWPLLLKCWKLDNQSKKQDFDKSVRLMESFACKSVIAGKRSHTGTSELQRLAKDFIGDFKALNSSLENLRNGWDIPRSFAFNLDAENFYDWGRVATYLLWRYENHLRSQKGKQNPRLEWDTIVKPTSKAVMYSKDHIEPKDPENQNLAKLVKWNDDDREARPFADVYLHRLGNLVLDTISTGSAKGNGNFSSRRNHYTANSTFLSQGEIVTVFASKDPITNGEIWDEIAIKNRHMALSNFAINHL